MYPRESPCAIQARKLLRKTRQETSGPVLQLRSKFPRKFILRSPANYAKINGGLHTAHATKECCRYEKDGMLKANFRATRKADKKLNPTKQSFAQLSKKLDKLEKTFKKASPKSMKHHRDDSDSDSK
jgi:hypothetical protein